MNIIKTGVPSDHVVKLAIDLEDGGDLIEVTVPLSKWMPRKHVRAYTEWVKECRELAAKYDAWEKRAASKRGPAPCDPDDLPLSPYQYQIRVLKPFVTDDEFTRLWAEATPGLAEQITAAMDGDGEVTEGESGASAS